MWRWWWWKKNNGILWPENRYKCATFFSLNSAPEELTWVGSVLSARNPLVERIVCKRHVMSKHRSAGLTPFQTVAMFSQKFQRFRFEHPFTSTIAGMTGSGKTTWLRSLLQQASETIYPPPERIVWCYSQRRPAYTEMLIAMPYIEFVKGIPTALEQDILFWCEQTEFDRAWWSDDWRQ